MLSLNQKSNTTFLFSTHDPAVIKFAKKIIILKDGMINSDNLSSDIDKKYTEN